MNTQRARPSLFLSGRIRKSTMNPTRMFSAVGKGILTAVVGAVWCVLAVGYFIETLVRTVFTGRPTK